MDFDKNKDIYKEYQDVSDELLDPICDPQMDLSIKYELYVSKYKYLKILQKDCMKSINQNKTSGYFFNDLLFIKKAVHTTQAHIRETILEELKRVFK